MASSVRPIPDLHSRLVRSAEALLAQIKTESAPPPAPVAVEPPPAAPAAYAPGRPASNSRAPSPHFGSVLPQLLAFVNTVAQPTGGERVGMQLHEPTAPELEEHAGPSHPLRELNAPLERDFAPGAIVDGVPERPAVPTVGPLASYTLAVKAAASRDARDAQEVEQTQRTRSASSRGPSRASGVEAERATAPARAPTIAEIVFALEGPLTAEQVKMAEGLMRFLSDAQIDRLVARTDLADKSTRFSDFVATKKAIDLYYDHYDLPLADEQILRSIGKWIIDWSITPSMAAKLVTVLLTGNEARELSQKLDEKSIADLKALAGTASKQFKTDADALRELSQSLMALAPVEREKYLRATSWELSLIDRQLVKRLVEELTPDTLREALPSLPDGDAATLARELTRQDKLSWYLGIQRAPRKIEAYAPSPALLAKIESAQSAIAEADELAAANGVSVASAPSVLAEARALYADAAQMIRQILAAEPLAIQDPAIQAWTERRAAALLVRSAVEEVESGAVGKKAGGRADPELIASLKSALGFDPSGKINAGQRAALVEEMRRRTLSDVPADPLISVMMPPLSNGNGYSHTHVIFAPGVMPVDGILQGALEQLKSRYGVGYEYAGKGPFDFEPDRTWDIRRAFDSILDQDPDARIVLVGYSQGSAHVLSFLDQLRSGPPEDRALADRVVSVVSLYGAHNGTTAAEDAVRLFKTALSAVPEDERLDSMLSGIRTVSRYLSGGVDPLKRSSRHRFWEIANLPTDIPYVSLSANAKPEEIPASLKKTHEAIEKSASKAGLPTENDGQVLLHDAHLGNEETEMGRRVARSTTNVIVPGHHLNPLTTAQLKTEAEPGKQSYPKTAQLEAPVALLAELGVLA